MKTTTFALFFGNRGFFPETLIAHTRDQIVATLSKAGYGYIMMSEEQIRYGAVETISDGEKYAAFLCENEGKYQGVILSLPNFGDENGAMVALKDCKVPIYVQACRDYIGKMDFEHRRDSVCGKVAMCNVLRQCGIKYTLFPPFAVDPDEPELLKQIEKFASVCRIVEGMRHFSIGAIGARTTAFKTVRVDEIALQNKGINVESFDLSDVIRQMENVSAQKTKTKRDEYLEITVYKGFPMEKLNNIARLGVVIDTLISEFSLNAIAIRCWSELQLKFGITPCLILSELNERRIQAACEVDICNAVVMRALSLAGNGKSMLLDINNNYNCEDDKCVLFHCGPVPPSMLQGKGITVEHKMFAKSYGPGSGVGVNQGKINTGNVTFGSLKTENGALHTFIGEGELLDDPLDPGFFGTGTVLRHKNIQDILMYIGKEGYRHHLSLAFGSLSDAVTEAFENYLGYKVMRF